ncbi:uncharacterized protein LOC128199455 isoform X2 [Bicyclus anynana]|uniref:Uncharacterized protein LOC128199455 isoform X2 n=1 Tax=Bicyclus anynana TaxID=110368 RepID=A0ABM3M292_BICAN|nr:uncharacterized protein LOC128199455 isoform X2 [Bicyclus anynana]
MIHNNSSLDVIQKLYYLRSYLIGEPLDLIKNLPITPESYSEALKLLENRYENKYKIVNEHISHLLDLKCITKSTASNLRDFVSCIRQQLAAISIHEPNVIHWSPILLCIFSRKLDSFTTRAYQMDRSSDNKPSLEEFLQYLEKRALALENAEQGHTEGNSRVAALATQGSSCSYCKSKEHKLFKCKKFYLLTAQERILFIEKNKLCITCLGTHKGKCRFHFRCSDCKGCHNSLVCNSPALAPPVTLTGNIDNNVLLPTARVKVFSKNGREYRIKALLDSGSQVSLVTSKVIKILGLTPTPNNTNIIGISNTKNNTKYCIPLEVHSMHIPFKKIINCHVVENITCKLPQSNIDISKIHIPNNITLADEQFNVPSEIHILIGADVFFQTLLPSNQSVVVVPMNLSSPAANDPHGSQQVLPTASCHTTSQGSPGFELHIFPTLFGHIIGGGLPVDLSKPSCHKVALKCELDIQKTISQFWSYEKVPELFHEKTSEQELCEQIFQSSVKLENNHFQVALPLKLPLEDINGILGESFHLALKRFLNLEKKLHSNPNLFMQYQRFIHEYLSLNHGHYMDIELYDINKQATYYLPHHAVINENSSTTRLRCVFDASMKTDKKVSLNSLQLNGPVVQKDLFDILMLFRFGKYTFTTDIKHMFRNIKIDPKFTSLQNILWRDNPSESIKCIRLDTVTYGLKSSSYLAIRYENLYPLASNIINNHTYVDDILYTDHDFNSVITARNQLREILSLGGFHTHKWASNNKSILSDIPQTEQQHFCSLDLQKENFDMKALGLRINVIDDNFIISSPEPFNPKEITKRRILSYIGRFYDPMGFASPIIVTAKVIMQKLWLQNIDWNSTPPLNIQEEWVQFTADLLAMEPIKLSRNIDISENYTAELVGFADASSSTAYGCCVYLRVNKLEIRRQLLNS